MICAVAVLPLFVLLAGGWIAYGAIRLAHRRFIRGRWL